MSGRSVVMIRCSCRAEHNGRPRFGAPSIPRVQPHHENSLAHLAPEVRVHHDGGYAHILSTFAATYIAPVNRSRFNENP